MSKTIAEIARERGVTPQAIHKAKKKAELKYGEVSGEKDPLDMRVVRYSGADLERLLEFCPPVQQSQLVPTAAVVELVDEAEEELPTSKIIRFEATQFDVHAAISQLDGALGDVLEDTGTLVDAVEMLTDRVLNSLEQKVGQQEQKLQEERTQLYRLGAIKDDFKRRSTVAAQRSKSLAKEQSSVTDELQRQSREVIDLGKPRSPSSD